MWRRSERRARDDRGSVTLFMSLVLVVLLAMGAFVVDLGTQRVARADMQALADLVALDLARELDGRTVGELRVALPAALDDAVERNGDVVGSQEPDVTFELGVMNAEGRFQAMASGVPSAVSVHARTAVDFGFAAVLGKEGGAAERDAAAQSSSTACFRLGSFVASIRSGDSTVLDPLNDLLGVKLDLVSYQGLAAADVTLAELSAVETIGSPTALLDGEINLGTLLRATQEALKNEHDSHNTVAISALSKLIGSSVVADVGSVRLGDVLHVSPSDSAALDVALDVLDIVGSARLADGNYFLTVPNIQAGVPGVGFQFSGALYLVSAAELACGTPNSPQAVADNAQLSGDLGIEFVNLPSLNVAGIGSLQTPKGTGTLHVVVGDGTGQLVSPPAPSCGTNTATNPATLAVSVASGLASYTLGANITVAGDVKTTLLQSLGLGNLLNGLLGGLLGSGKTTIEIDVALKVGTTASPVTDLAKLSMPPNDVDPVHLGTAVTLDPNAVTPTVTGVRLGGKAVPVLSSVTALTDKVLAELVGNGNEFVGKTLKPLIDNVNQRFVGPVARMVGLRLGGADVFAAGVTCGRPRLTG